MSATEADLLQTLGRLVDEHGVPVSATDVAAAAHVSVRSAAALLSNLTRIRTYDARPIFSGGTHSDGAMYGPGVGIERYEWAERTEDGRYRPTEHGWFNYYRDEAADRTGHYGTPSEGLLARARAQVIRFGGEPTGFTAPHDDEDD